MAGNSALVIYGTTDTDVFRDVLADFRAVRPDVEVRHVELDAGEADARYLREVVAGRPTADLILSSAMDLQFRLANDGHARRVRIGDAAWLPDWAKWRDEAFGVTFEPAVMVFNRRLMAGRRIPASRADLVAALGADPAFWRGRVTTYDAARSRVGYLLETQDARQNPQHGALADALAASDVRTAETSAAMLARIERGELIGGYNILASYARRRLEAGAPIAIVHPSDYTLVLSRTAVLTRAGANRAAADAFLAYLLSSRGQQRIARVGRLDPIRTDMGAVREGLSPGEIGRFRPIALGTGLLVHLDRRKRERFLAARPARRDASVATASPPSIGPERR